MSGANPSAKGRAAPAANAAEPAEGGHRFPVRVYYEDTDAAGIVYYANYLRFAERARTELLRDLGFAHERLRRERGLAFAVRRCAVDYHRPARLDDLLEVRTRIVRLGGASLDLLQAIFSQDQLLCDLEVRLALLDGDLRPARLPAELGALLLPAGQGPRFATRRSDPVVA